MMPCHPEPLNPPGESAHAEASQVFITQGRVSKNYMHLGDAFNGNGSVCGGRAYRIPEVRATQPGKCFPSGMDSEPDGLHGQPHRSP